MLKKVSCRPPHGPPSNKNAPHHCEAFGAENEKQTRPHKLLLHQFISQEKVPYSNNADAN